MFAPDRSINSSPRKSKTGERFSTFWEKQESLSDVGIEHLAKVVALLTQEKHVFKLRSCKFCHPNVGKKIIEMSSAPKKMFSLEVYSSRNKLCKLIRSLPTIDRQCVQAGKSFLCGRIGTCLSCCQKKHRGGGEMLLVSCCEERRGGRRRRTITCLPRWNFSACVITGRRKIDFCFLS
ncbi:hypothetical protein CDAR_52731 [Caerostris darwini]|uniref:Uncharacterized protein n=1 Tax=Caerostris darwini TaxID=1538125 RepID=A0AAV4T117_9ARAC|nr:hypothetical protein CDAR_52731 [Caerostris darwini]